VTFGVGALALDVVARQQPDQHAALALAVPLFVLGLGAGAVITPNQTLTLIDVDPVTGSTAGGVLQTSQRIGAAIGQAVVGAAFFAALPAGVDDLTGSERSAAFGDALGQAIMVSLLFVAAALAVGIIDLVLTRRRRTPSDGSDGDRRAQEDAPVTHP
jgi:hypothetical protein